MNDTTDTKAAVPPLGIDELLENLDASGMTTAAFARANGIPPWKLYNTLRSRAKKRLALVPVLVKPDHPASSGPLELTLASGHRLCIPADFDEQALRRLMGVLAGC